MDELIIQILTTLAILLTSVIAVFNGCCQSSEKEKSGSPREDETPARETSVRVEVTSQTENRLKNENHETPVIKPIQTFLDSPKIKTEPTNKTKKHKSVCEISILSDDSTDDILAKMYENNRANSNQVVNKVKQEEISKVKIANTSKEINKEKEIVFVRRVAKDIEFVSDDE
jgi:hypothetical protein